MRPRPKWRAPLRSYPKGGGPGVNDAFLARRSAFGDFSPGSGRRQCRAIAKSTGEQCRCDAVQGAFVCRKHRGIASAFVNAKRKDSRIQRSNNVGESRRTLASLAFMDTPEGLKVERIDTQTVARGRLFEAWRNRELDPESYKAALYACQIKSKT